MPRAGFLLTRHWRDSPHGTEIILWLATDAGAQRVVLPVQESVAFIPEEFQAQVSELLKDERQFRIQSLALKDFRRRPVLASTASRTVSYSALKNGCAKRVFRSMKPISVRRSAT